jgi:hypothetical protein
VKMISIANSDLSVYSNMKYIGFSTWYEAAGRYFDFSESDSCMTNIYRVAKEPVSFRYERINERIQFTDPERSPDFFAVDVNFKNEKMIWTLDNFIQVTLKKT